MNRIALLMTGLLMAAGCCCKDHNNTASSADSSPPCCGREYTNTSNSPVSEKSCCCCGGITNSPDSVEINTWLVETVADVGVRDAIVRQHTLFAYQFEPNSPNLNELGRHDLDVLADAYRQNPGPLSIRRGDATPALYKARVESVNDALRQAGVDVSRVKVVDAPAGGDGMASDRVFNNLHKPEAAPSNAPSTYVITPQESQ